MLARGAGFLLKKALQKYGLKGVGKNYPKVGTVFNSPETAQKAKIIYEQARMTDVRISNLFNKYLAGKTGLRGDMPFKATLHESDMWRYFGYGGKGPIGKRKTGLLGQITERDINYLSRFLK